MKKFLPMILIFMVIPYTVYAQNTTIIGNPNITIKTEVQESPETRELLKHLVESQRNQSINFNKLLDEFNKKNLVIETKEKPWTDSDLLAVSSTIVGFFGFGSFVIIRFQSDNRKLLAKYMKFVFYIVGFVILTHLLMIYSIVHSGSIAKETYQVALVITMISVTMIMITMGDIITEENKEKRAREKTRTAVEKLKKDLVARINQRKGNSDDKI